MAKSQEDFLGDRRRALEEEFFRWADEDFLPNAFLTGSRGVELQAVLH